MANEKRLIDANTKIIDKYFNKRLISLDEALKATHSEIYWTESQQAAVRSFLVKQPKVDAVEVVRCKDCRWAEDIESSLLRDVFVSGAKNCIIKRGDDAYGLGCSVVSPNDFCSDGERKNNG